MLKLVLPLVTLMILPMMTKSKYYWWLMVSVTILMTFMALPLLSNSNMYIYSPSSMIDLMSSSLIILSLLIAALMMVASSKIYLEASNPKMFALTNISLLIILILSFSSSSLINFYIWFEASLIPTMIIIMTWGYQPERVQASMYLMMYTVTASLPMLMLMWWVVMYSGHMNMGMPHLWSHSPFFMNFMWLILIMGFLVKLPMFSTHLWLPKAHVEAPIAGSMVLAAILLKLGGYGLLRMINMMSKINFNSISSMLISLSLCGAVVTSLICLRQSDLKSLIAYSSVGHMGLMLAGMMSNSNWSMYGSLMMMIAHGLCSSGLFILANITYEITHTRSVYLTKGLMSVCPALTLWWFMFTAWNMAAPPSINLMSEIILITSVLSMSSTSMILLMIISFLAAAYSLNMYTMTQHGHIPSFTNPMSSMKIKDMNLLFMHLWPIVILIVKPELLSLWN